MQNTSLIPSVPMDEELKPFIESLLYLRYDAGCNLPEAFLVLDRCLRELLTLQGEAANSNAGTNAE